MNNASLHRLVPVPGLTAAFSAPVSGAMFVFEEVHKSFYPYLVIPTFVATLISNYITVTIFGLTPALGFSVTSGMPLDYFPVLLGVGILMGLCGVLICRMIFAFKRLFEWMKCSRFLKLVITFVTVDVIGFDSQLLLGGGNDLVGQLAFQLMVYCFSVALCWVKSCSLPFVMAAAHRAASFYRCLLSVHQPVLFVKACFHPWD